MAPHSGFYPIPAGFRAYSVYDIRHILRTGHEIRLSEKHNVTSYSSGIYLGTDDILRHKVDASVMLLLGLRPRDLQPYYHFGLWSPLVAFPLAVLALYYALCRCNNRKARSVDAVALVAFSVLGSFMMIDVTFHGETNTATGWTFMAVAMYGLVRIREAPLGGRIVFFLFTALVVLLYHTAAIVLACSAVSIGTFELMRRGKWDRRSQSAATMLVAGIFVAWYFTYVSVSFFDLFAKSLGSVPNLIGYLFREQSSAVPRGFALGDLLTHNDSGFAIPLVCLSLLVAMPVAAVIMLGLGKRLEGVAGERSVSVVYPWLVGLVPLTTALFIWGGVSGVQGKDGEFGSLFCIFALAAIMSGAAARTARRWVVILVVASVGLSSYLYIDQEQYGASYLTYPEYRGATWLAANSPQDKTVFTDLRLAAPLIVNNHLAVEGTDDYLAAKIVRTQLMSIYYQSHSSMVWRGLQEVPVAPQTSLGYAMFSTRESESLPGIKGYDYNFRAAPRGFMHKFRYVPGFSLIYSNGTIEIFKIARRGKGRVRGQ